MVIKNKTRKILWARSGNLCAICGKELISSATNLDPEAVIGDECHINARNSGGPRYDSSLSESYIDSYDNLILLCKVHHKIIDDQPNSYPSAGLKIIKRRHEKWVRDNLLSEEESNKSKKKILSRVQTGKDLLNIVIGSHAYDFDYDEPNGEKEINLISEFLQFAQDYGDIGDSIEFGERVN
ncbi:MAG: HNH endonuclease, partial [Brevefilum sp.]